MPSVQSADQFIERSLLLLQTSPATTRISITYSSRAKKAENLNRVRKSKTAAESFVSFKVFDPVSGTLYKLTTHRTKELSRILTALGPHGVQATKPVKSSHKKVNEDDTTVDADGDVAVEQVGVRETQKQNQITENFHLRGFSSVLANAEIEEESVEEVKEEPKKEVKKETAKKGKKKKGKR